ncbi:hypothetical protein GBAR_LOCUS6948 [Geodia barretti]|uniref:Uncharacterized protein n=1 Tax=Geodia barretti TaxID=519541 RepID=A0AA35RFJ6_GEOBA|nr:hypothetical protein GBAR_LOCUS6948 [Geodia barretti]
MQVQCSQCPLCFRPNTSHHEDPSLAQRILLFHVYCTSRQKGCNWQGMLRDLELHMSSDEGCQFSLVECPLAVFGCKQHSLMRRDLNRHMTDKHTKHITTVIGESPIRITEEPPNKGHYGGSDCREVVPISEVK